MTCKHDRVEPKWHTYYSHAKNRLTTQQLWKCRDCGYLLQYYGGKLEIWHG